MTTTNVRRRSIGILQNIPRPDRIGSSARSLTADVLKRHSILAGGIGQDIDRIYQYNVSSRSTDYHSIGTERNNTADIEYFVNLLQKEKVVEPMGGHTCHLYLLQQRSPPYRTPPEKPTQPGPTYIPTPKQLLETIITGDLPNIELRTPAERSTSLLRLGGMSLFTVPSRAGLLDKYSTFALPGTSPHNKIKDFNRTIMKNRLYMYENLRLIALDGIKPDLSTTFMLNMLDKASASRDKSTHHIWHALDKAGIPLRLDV
ncbi:Hypothetical predicted protein [Mytilus galloprovincialis]|uniref:Uncharacterized protein n=1 Tax=Mytilus galloprovincialis TaxID=29158 RepID=A0A8B6GK34_MYTGA|nr:Hypothetical predicted protein [Mytilus galloprovincialis]